MSHFVVGVIIPQSKLDCVEGTITELLAPYDEELKVPEYDRECHCINTIAEHAGFDTAIDRFGKIDEIQKSFSEEHRDLTDEDELDRLWKERVTPVFRLKDEVARAHPMWGYPDPTCGFYTEDYCPVGKTVGTRFEDGSGCGGTGTYRSTYNPAAKYDWFEIGGRWDGQLYEFYEVSSSDNIVDRNVRQISKLLAKEKPYLPFALITPKGEWLEKGEMGWFGCASNEKEPADWEALVRQAYEKYSDHLLVLVDFHI